MDEKKAQSETISLLLLIGISVVSIGVISSYSAPAVSDSTEFLSNQETENSFLSLSSKMKSISSESSTGSIEIDTGDETAVIEPEAARINITQEYRTGPWDNRSLYEGKVGRIEHSGGDETVAYEGGGVFKKEPGSNNSVMLSGPEVHVEGRTLRFSVYNITAEAGSVGGSSVSFNPNIHTNTVFPNGSYSAPNEEAKTNPILNGTVYVTVESRYFDAWRGFFDSEAGIEVVDVDPSAGPGRVKARLLSTRTPEVQTAGVSAREYATRDDPFDGNVTDGVVYPNADSWIKSTGDYMRGASGDVEPVSECEGASAPCPSGAYYAEGNHTLNAEVNTNGNVTILVDGKTTVESLSVDGNPSNYLRVVSTEGIGLSDGYSVEVNSGERIRLLLYVPSDKDVTFLGSGNGDGVIYAAGSTVSLNGISGAVWNGSIVAEEIDTTGVGPGTQISFAGGVDIGGFENRRSIQISEKRIEIE